MTEETQQGGNRAQALTQYLKRVEKLVEERKQINDCIKDVKGDAVADGFDRGTIDEMLKLRKLDPDVRNEREELRDLYASTLGLI